MKRKNLGYCTHRLKPIAAALHPILPSVLLRTLMTPGAKSVHIWVNEINLKVGIKILETDYVVITTLISFQFMETSSYGLILVF